MELRHSSFYWGIVATNLAGEQVLLSNLWHPGRNRVRYNMPDTNEPIRAMLFRTRSDAERWLRQHGSDLFNASAVPVREILVIDDERAT